VIDKRCTKCGIVKPLTAFNRNKRAGELRSECRVCGGVAFKRWYAANRDKCLKRNRENVKRRQVEKAQFKAVPAHLKLCTHCSKIQRRTAFGRNKSRPDGLSSQCKACRKDYAGRVRSAKLDRKPVGNLRQIQIEVPSGFFEDFLFCARKDKATPQESIYLLMRRYVDVHTEIAP